MKITRLSIYAAAALLFGTSAFAQLVIVDSRENWIIAQVDWGHPSTYPDGFEMPPSINYAKSTSLTDPFDDWINATDSNHDHYLDMSPLVDFEIHQTATVSDSGFAFSGLSRGSVNNRHPHTPPNTGLYLSNYTEVTFHVTQPATATLAFGTGGALDLVYVDFEGIGYVYDGDVLNLEPGVSYHFIYGINYFGPLFMDPGVSISSEMSMTIAAVPEPATTALFIAGAATAFALLRRKRKAVEQGAAANSGKCHVSCLRTSRATHLRG